MALGAGGGLAHQGFAAIAAQWINGGFSPVQRCEADGGWGRL
ncbi:MAG: hypothetical protein QGH25_01365 [Candidatus Latescibacteria bacterium]|nr:hypothetical protein [Candidatus Latescibacterota bacterium]